MFYPGQEVECISDNMERHPDNVRLGVVFPVKGGRYRVREVRRDITPVGTITGLLLREIVNPVIGYWKGAVYAETSFAATLFRPLVDEEEFIIEHQDAPADRELELA
jgi:hypothetical protein